MSLVNFGYRTNMQEAELPPIGGFLVGYDLDGILKQKDHLGVITIIGGSGSYTINNGGASLPVPKIHLVSGEIDEITGMQYKDITWVDKSGNSGTFSLHNYPVVIAEDFIPEQLQTGNIFVEMVHYRRKTTSTSTYNKAGYVTAGAYYQDWPSYLPWANNFWVRNNSGGNGPGGISMTVERENYFLVESQYQRIPVYKMLNGRFHENDVAYRDIYNVNQNLNTIIPSVGYSRGGRQKPSRRFAYSSYYTPYYIAYRYIQYIPESNTIVSGPLSTIIKITHKVFPFQVDYQKSALYDTPVCTINNSYRKYDIRCSIENKLP